MEKAQSINMFLCIKPCGVMEGISCHLCCLINHVIISLTFSAASPSLSVLLVMELLFTLASFWGAALVSKPAQWYILNNLVPGGLDTVCNSPAETRGWFLEVFCQEADLERGSGIAHSGGMWRWPRTETPLSGSYECLSALLSQCLSKDLQQEIHRQRKDKKESCIKNECRDRNMHLGTWLSMIGFPCKLWVRNYWDLQV